MFMRDKLHFVEFDFRVKGPVPDQIVLLFLDSWILYMYPPSFFVFYNIGKASQYCYYFFLNAFISIFSRKNKICYKMIIY